MPYFVYILFSKKDRKLYIGCTDNPERRLYDHNIGKVQATKLRRPLVMIHTEEYADKGEAFNRERFLKTLWSARFKQKVLKEYINKVGREKQS